MTRHTLKGKKPMAYNPSALSTASGEQSKVGTASHYETNVLPTTWRAPKRQKVENKVVEKCQETTD